MEHGIGSDRHEDRPKRPACALELIPPMQAKAGLKVSLLAVLDRTVTPIDSWILGGVAGQSAIERQAKSAATRRSAGAEFGKPASGLNQTISTIYVG